MKSEPRFPAGTHGNADFITRSSKLQPGERVINTQVDLENLGHTGWLCIKESTVRAMMKKLNIKEAPPKTEQLIADLEAENERLREKLARTQAAYVQLNEVLG